MWRGKRGAFFLAVLTRCRLSPSEPLCLPVRVCTYEILNRPIGRCAVSLKLFRCIALIGVRSISVFWSRACSCVHGFTISNRPCYRTNRTKFAKSNCGTLLRAERLFVVTSACVFFQHRPRYPTAFFSFVFFSFFLTRLSTPPHQPTKISPPRTSSCISPQPVSKVSWPSLLKKLAFGHRFDPSSLNGLVWPEGLKAIQLGRVSRAVNDDRRIHPWGAWDEPEG